MLDLDKYGSAVDAAVGFIRSNYPCGCGEEDCAGQYFEAEALVELVVNTLAL